MERIDRRAPESGDPNGCPAASPLMRSKVRAYSHQGHGPRADRQAGYISATSDSTPSLANGSRSIHLGRVSSCGMPIRLPQLVVQLINDLFTIKRIEWSGRSVSFPKFGHLSPKPATTRDPSRAQSDIR